MVNNTNPYSKVLPNIDVPASEADDRRIMTTGPLWSLDRLINAMLNHAKNEDLFYNCHEADPEFEYLLDEYIRFDTEKSRQEYSDLLLVQGLDVWVTFSKFKDRTKGARYDGSQWCLPDSNLVSTTSADYRPCDSYQFCGYFVDPNTEVKSEKELYLKFSESIDGKLILYVSFHRSIRRNY
jgi:hypothetical protein